MDGARGQREKMLKLMLVHHHKIGLPFPKQPSSYSVLFVFSNPQAFHHIVFNVESTTLPQNPINQILVQRTYIACRTSLYLSRKLSCNLEKCQMYNNTP